MNVFFFFFNEGILGISLSMWPHKLYVLHVISFSLHSTPI
jgi:hypothetical protein